MAVSPKLVTKNTTCLLVSGGLLAGGVALIILASQTKTSDELTSSVGPFPVHIVTQDKQVESLRLTSYIVGGFVLLCALLVLVLFNSKFDIRDMYSKFKFKK